MRVLPTLGAAPLVVLLFSVAACGGGDDSADDSSAAATVTVTPTPPEPTFVESDACRTAAASVLADAEAARTATDSETIRRYEDAVIAGVDGISCSAPAYDALVKVANAVDRYRGRWLGCEIGGSFLDWDGDGQPDGTGDCSEANGAFVKLGAAIQDARSMVDLMS
jgi:hypothetical protein